MDYNTPSIRGLDKIDLAPFAQVKSKYTLFSVYQGFGQALLWIWWFGFKLEPISSDGSAASKNTACFIRGQKWLKK